MRTIKFRGKRIDNGEWVYGYVDYTELPKVLMHTESETWEIKVIPETVGQFTGLFDKDGSEIYEGDILLANGYKSEIIHDMSEARKFVSSTIDDIRETKPGRYEFVCKWYDPFSGYNFYPLDFRVNIECEVSKRNFKVIGNIHDKTSDQ